jgi:hypothetical protein
MLTGCERACAIRRLGYGVLAVALLVGLMCSRYGVAAHQPGGGGNRATVGADR